MPFGKEKITRSKPRQVPKIDKKGYSRVTLTGVNLSEENGPHGPYLELDVEYTREGIGNDLNRVQKFIAYHHSPIKDGDGVYESEYTQFAFAIGAFDAEEYQKVYETYDAELLSEFEEKIDEEVERLVNENLSFKCKIYKVKKKFDQLNFSTITLD